MRMGLTISVVGHAAALLWAVVSFGVKSHDVPPIDALPIDLISVTEFSQMTAGIKTAPKVQAAKPLVEKVAEAKPVDNAATKVTEKPEIITASAQMSDPAPKPPEPKAEAKPEAKPQQAEKKADAKPDPATEALKKDDGKKHEAKKEEAKAPAPKNPPQPKPLDFKNIEQKLALLDKREGQRRAYTGETLNATPSLGTTTGHAPTLSQNEMDALRACLANRWNLPAGAAESKDLNI